MFIQDFLLKSITIKGEVSNCKYHSSGHIYFTLKDRGGAISCVMFRGDRDKGGLRFDMKEGQQVKQGQKVVVLEAMKMENEIPAPKDGTITVIHVHKGDSLQEGDPVVTIA